MSNWSSSAPATLAGTLILAVSWLALVAVPGGSEANAAAAGTRCTYEHEADVSPGLALQETAGTVRDDPGRPGHVECDGPIYGFTPTGPGTFLVSARYHGDCLRGGGGDTDVTFTFPSADGERSVSDTATWTFGGPSQDPRNGPVRVHWEAKSFVLEGAATPTKGDCITAPVTRGRGRGVMTFH